MGADQDDLLGMLRPGRSSHAFAGVRSVEQPRTSRTRTGSPDASRRWSTSASSAETAAEGMRGTSLSYFIAPVCGSRKDAVPSERISVATPPSFAASIAPVVRSFAPAP